MPPQGLITQLNSAVIKGVCLFLSLHVFSFQFFYWKENEQENGENHFRIILVCTFS